MSAIEDDLDEKNYTLLYYGGLLYQYGKNVFFYRHTSENVRAGKQKFTLPHKTDIKNIYSNIAYSNHLTKHLLQLFYRISIQKILGYISKTGKSLRYSSDLWGKKFLKWCTFRTINLLPPSMMILPKIWNIPVF